MTPSDQEEVDVMSVSRWDPFQDLLAIQDEMNQVFGRARQGQGGGGRVWAPALDISERKDAYVVTVEVPGVNPDDLDITLEDGLLTIQGERQFTQESTEQQFHRVERRYGSFRRSITLPSQVQADAIEASFENGVLEVVVPKAEEAKPKKISVKAGGGRQEVTGTSTTPSGT
jgi:HSP20 family protein